MKITVIKYKVAGKTYEEVVQEKEGWEANYFENVVNRIESITNAETANGRHPIIVSVQQAGF